MPGLNIPGVTDQYNTSTTVERLIEVERVPLNREQEVLKTYQSQQGAWRDMNVKLNALRDSVRSLYSFDSPFQSKIAESSDGNAITAEAGNTASFGSFTVSVEKVATADRFLSKELDKNTKVEAGTYVFKSGEKSISMKWGGGTLQDFSSALNRRGDNTFRSNIINAGNDKKVLLIESLKTGSENRLSFERDALEFVQKIGMLGDAKDAVQTFGTAKEDIAKTPITNEKEQIGMPELADAQIDENGVILLPRTSVAISIPDDVKYDRVITFTIAAMKAEDITEEINRLPPSPALPSAGSASFNEIIIPNFPSDTTLPISRTPPEPLVPIEAQQSVYAIMADGSERFVETQGLMHGEQISVRVNMEDYSGIKAIAIRNRNTGTTLSVSAMSASDPKIADGLVPLNAITQADDAVIKYEGIKIQRPTNKIDDVIPSITLNISDKTEKPATITIKSDSENAKDALITFVGQYNQVVAEINVLTQNRPELINELTYLSDTEREALEEKLGMFPGDFTLTSMKNSMQEIVIAPYRFDDDSQLTLLAQLGISSNASGSGAGYNASRLRGYLEIDEKILDSALTENMEDIRKLFGFDSDGDMVIDSGIGYSLTQQIAAYTQSNGIIATRTNTLNSQIRTSEQRISRLETQLATREQQLRQQFNQMEGALNNLESQQTTIDNFMRQNTNNNRR